MRRGRRAKAKKYTTPSDPARPDQLTFDARVDDIMRIVLDGAKFHDIREFVREKEREPGSNWHIPDDVPRIHDSTLYRYRSEAMKRILADREKHRPNSVALHIARRENLYAKAVLAGDNRTALAVLRDLGEIEQVYPSEKKKADTSPPLHQPVDDDTILEPSR